MINLGTILKPLMLMQGVKDFRITFNADRQIVEITGTKNGDSFRTEQPFNEIEAAINSQTAADPAGSTTADKIVDPDRS